LSFPALSASVRFLFLVLPVLQGVTTLLTDASTILARRATLAHAATGLWSTVQLVTRM
jgi:hypothetical protein